MEGESQKDGEGTCSQGQSASSELDASQLRIVLVGRTGCGKSATGNSILGWQAFESRLSAQPVTRKCQRETGSWEGKTILVVDTPPIFEAKARKKDIARDVKECHQFLAPGPHVLLLVTKLGRFTEQDARAAKKVKKIFGAKAMKRAIVLFTHIEDLEDGSLEDYVALTDNRRLRKLVRKCGGRFCGINNKAVEEEQRQQLMNKVEQLRKNAALQKGHFLQRVRNRLFRNRKARAEPQKD